MQIFSGYLSLSDPHTWWYPQSFLSKPHSCRYSHNLSFFQFIQWICVVGVCQIPLSFGNVCYFCVQVQHLSQKCFNHTEALPLKWRNFQVTQNQWQTLVKVSPTSYSGQLIYFADLDGWTCLNPNYDTQEITYMNLLSFSMTFACISKLWALINLECYEKFFILKFFSESYLCRNFCQKLPSLSLI